MMVFIEAACCKVASIPLGILSRGFMRLPIKQYKICCGLMSHKSFNSSVYLSFEE